MVSSPHLQHYKFLSFELYKDTNEKSIKDLVALGFQIETNSLLRAPYSNLISQCIWARGKKR